ncbi:hypothetical protein ASD76_08410 [Altererythrobacter sp. Root672]|nr:hypothetical protein ASD76_08410 [Altererythrobacter sp. Root672]
MDRLEGEMAKSLQEAAIVPPKDFDHDGLGKGAVRALVVAVFDENPLRLRIAANVIDRGQRRDRNAPGFGHVDLRSVASVGPARPIAGWKGIAGTGVDAIG